MKTSTLALGLSIFLLNGTTLADEKCDDPISSWQPREMLRQQLEAKGWIIYRIKVDDSCYEVKALDANGKRIEAIFSPATLELIEVGHEDEADDDDKHRPTIKPDSTEITS